ncbi:MAG: hypothetical protein KIH64_009660 [Mycobacterium sp.]|nr:hypothetical protein [Mycobacterium sp.]
MSVAVAIEVIAVTASAFIRPRFGVSESRISAASFSAAVGNCSSLTAGEAISSGDIHG